MDIIRRISGIVGVGPFAATLDDDALLALVRHAAGWYDGITDGELLARVAALAETASIDFKSVATWDERGRVLDLVQGRARRRSR